MRLHSWLSSKCRVEPSSWDGLGVFATQPIDAEELVAVWGGVVYTREEVERLSVEHAHFRTHPLPVAAGFYLASTSLQDIDDAERFNHGCAPNVGIRGQILLAARRPIAVGEELAFDYDTTGPSSGGFACRCGAATCRGWIDGTASSAPEFRRRNEGWMSEFLVERRRGETRE